MTTEITGETALLWMFTHPVRHVRGSALINGQFDALGVDAAICPLHVLPEDLGYMLDAARKAGNLAGLGLTTPHKVAGCALMDHLTDAARLQGAVNFVRRNPDGTLTGHNIDGEGFVAGLKANGVSPAGRKVLVLGTGGVGRSIIFALAEAGVASLGIANRTRAGAEAIAKEISEHYPAVRTTVSDFGDPRALNGIDLLVNATSVGMIDTQAQPVPIDTLSSEAVVADVIVNPKMTTLLKAASAKGCKIITGDAMLTPQPALLCAFLGLEARNR